MEKKYEILKRDHITVDGRRLYRIRALRAFSTVYAGEIGGYIESKRNLSHYGDCWVADDAMVYGDATVIEDAVVSNEAQVYGSAHVCEHALVYGNAKVFENAKVRGNAKVGGCAKIYGSSVVGENARIYDGATIGGLAQVSGNAQVCGCASVLDMAVVTGGASANGLATVKGNAVITGDAVLKSQDDYLVFTDYWSWIEPRYITYTMSNNKWYHNGKISDAETMIIKCGGCDYFSKTQCEMMVKYANKKANRICG